MQKFKMYADPGHGWLAVKRALLESMGLLGKISRYSYQKGWTVYLEEDSDAPKFLRELKAGEFQLIEVHTDKRSPIRSYDSFKA